jgi:hypothetical protein
VNGAEADATSGIYLPRALLDWFDTGAPSTHPGVADPLRFGRRLASPALSGSVRTSRSTSNANGGSEIVGCSALVYSGNEPPNIGFPLLDCCSVASS